MGTYHWIFILKKKLTPGFFKSLLHMIKKFMITGGCNYGTRRLLPSHFTKLVPEIQIKFKYGFYENKNRLTIQQTKK